MNKKLLTALAMMGSTLSEYTHRQGGSIEITEDWVITNFHKINALTHREYGSPQEFIEAVCRGRLYLNDRHSRIDTTGQRKLIMRRSDG